MPYASEVQGNLAKVFELEKTQMFRRRRLSRSYTNYIGRENFPFCADSAGAGRICADHAGASL